MPKKRTNFFVPSCLEPPVLVRTLEEAEQALAELAQLQQAVQAMEADMSESVLRIRQVANHFMQPRQTRMATLVTGLMQFADENLSVGGCRRDIVTLSGSYGFRSASTMRPNDRGAWTTILKRLGRHGSCAAIRTHKAINWRRLQQWSGLLPAVVENECCEEAYFWYVCPSPCPGRGATGELNGTTLLEREN